MCSFVEIIARLAPRIQGNVDVFILVETPSNLLGGELSGESAVRVSQSAEQSELL